MQQPDLIRLLQCALQRDWQGTAQAAKTIRANELARNARSPIAMTIERLLGEAERTGMADDDKALMLMLPKSRHGESSILERRATTRGLGDMRLHPALRRVLENVVAENRDPRTLLDHGFTPARRLFFAGPPGCGKTATAGAIAHELGRPYFVARIDAVIDSYMGETASNVRRIFDFIAQGPPMVVCLDEFDALAADRSTADRSGTSGEIGRTTNAILQMLDSFQSDTILVATTNLDTEIDAAMWRRFDESVIFPPPTPKQAWEYARSFMLEKAGQGPADADEDAWTSLVGHFTFAEIERLITRAAKRFVFGGGSLMACLQAAVKIETERPDFAFKR